ncbi:MAG: threonine aldolase family protein [Candidatus Hodarchaeales archaeon]|jgi:threonine aldolase
MSKTPIIDLRSDTVTKPTPDMWKALRQLDDSHLGDDVYGEDPTVNELEMQAAKLMNKEAALLVTSGTQGNLTSLLSSTHPGQEIIIEEKSHIYLYEVGSAARIGGLTTKAFKSPKGFPDIDLLETMIRPRNDLHQPWTTLLAVENTHNTHGGVVVQPRDLGTLSKFVTDHEMKFHLDGARIFNAAAALDVPLPQLTRHVDSIMFCLSKGMACPVGSIIAGSQEFIDRARKFRKMLGGGMRQAGIIAVMGLVALQHDWRKQLKQDHVHAKILARALQEENDQIVVKTPETNIIKFSFPEGAPIIEIHKSLVQQGLLGIYKGSFQRLVTHVGLSRENIDTAVSMLNSTFKRLLSS